jgi:hypothetical protein
MKKQFARLIEYLPLPVIFGLLLGSCTTNETATFKRIRDHTNAIKVINTHEHQHLPSEFGNFKYSFYFLAAVSYLASDLSSAGAPKGDPRYLESLSPDKLWELYGKSFDFTRTTSYYSQFVKGFRKLYDFNDLFFTKENIGQLSPKIEENYKNYDAWFDKAFKTAGYELMFIDQYWKPFNTTIDTAHYALAFNINSLIESSSKKPGTGSDSASMFRQASHEGAGIKSLDDYLAYCDHLFKKNIEGKVVCIKNSQAYSRTLYYDNVPYEEAKTLFDRPSPDLTSVESKKIEDFVFHWIIKKATLYDLPVQIHTGYLAGNGNVLDNGHPIKLNNLFLLYPKTKFVLFHGGFPWTGEIAALAKMFPNVYLDLVWLPQISREEAINALDVMLDCVPYNKFFWGGDCGLIEESVGSLEYAKDVVSEVLAKRVKRGLLTEKLAVEITDRIFRENAIEVFKLKEKLGRDFNTFE